MLTTMDSPTSTSKNSVLASCSQVADAASTLEQPKEPVSPSKQDLSCAKHPSSKSRHLHRHSPYDVSARSPGSCSSDGGDSVQSDADSQDSTNRVQTKVKRIAANSRERKRMHTVNSAFDQLRELVPTYPSNRKLSKIDTLRLACTYIQDLVSLLHNTQAIQGDDVLYNQPPFPDAFNGYPVTVKQEMADFQPFPAQEHFRMQPAACVARFPTEGCPESYTSSASESDSTATHSPPHHFMPPQIVAAPPPPGGSRPPPLTRVTSEGTATIHTRMAEATISNGSQSPTGSCAPLTLPLPPQPAQTQTATSMYQQQQQQRQVNITSPLAMHAVHHSSTITPNLLQNNLGHHSPPPVWQRPTMPNGFAVYGQ